MRPWVSVDFDGTVANHPFRYLVLPRIFQRFHDVPPGRLLALCRKEQRRRLSGSEAISAWDWDDLARFLAEAVGAGGHDALPTVAEETIAAARDTPEKDLQALVYDDVPQALQDIRTSARLLLLTNGLARYQIPLVRRLGLLTHFDAVLTPDAVGRAKPDPLMTASIEGPILGHIGDILGQDVLFAKRAGIRSVWIDRDGDPQLPLRQRLASALEREPLPPDGDAVWPDHVIRTLSEAAPLVRQWSADPPPPCKKE